MQQTLQFGAAQARQTQRFEATFAAPQVTAEKAADDGEQPLRNRRVDLRPARRRGEERQAEFGVFADVAVRVQIDVFAPVAAFLQLLANMIGLKAEQLKGEVEG